MKAELHSHSHYSKGKKVIVEGFHSPEEMLRHAQKTGLDILSVTDHETFKGSEQALRLEKKFDVLVLPGQELKCEKGHLLAYGLQEEIQSNLSLEESIDLIHQQGGIAVAPHPFDLAKEGIGKDCLKCDAMESFNSLNRDFFSNRKAAKFAVKHSMPETHGSDSHANQMMGAAPTWIKAEKDVESVLKALRKGEVKFDYSRYQSAKAIKDWSVGRLKQSKPYVQDYIARHYRFPKSTVSRAMLKLVDYSPGRIDYVFTGLAHFSLGCAVALGAVKYWF